MSEPVTALRNAGYAAGIAEVNEIGPLGMITLRGDLAASPIRSAAAKAGGVDLPGQRQCSFDAKGGIAWMSPDELLILCPYGEVAERLDALRSAIAQLHALAVNVSDARAVFELGGPHAREVMGKLAPVDFSPYAFTPGMFRRSRMAQVPAAFWLQEPETFRIVCFRSVAQYMFDLLKIAAQPGSDVGLYAK
ncbi:sarcosine oxidase subunit gamma [Sulfitobacter aestuarii]|uniref:Sarcosine oxidase subunit gamma n=1 Tax=Sulfitobacter aestuarii TaxID=2161676 RepID=A0ABW5U295_9RHOB